MSILNEIEQRLNEKLDFIPLPTGKRGEYSLISPAPKGIDVVHYAINPTKAQFLKILSDPLSEYTFYNRPVRSVRMAFVGDNLYAWPGNVLHNTIEDLLNELRAKTGENINKLIEIMGL